MIEVFAVEGGFRWKMISICGRDLYWGDPTIYTTNHAAAMAADKWRTSFWCFASGVDGRMPGAR